MRSRFVRALSALSLVVLLASCGKDQGGTTASTDSPQGAISAAVQSLKSGDLKALVESQVPPTQLEKLRTKWKTDMAEEAASESDRAQFAQMMADLTASDAETKLMEQLEPQLVNYEQNIVPQMPMMVGMGKGLIMQGIQENKELTESQKAEAAKSIDALIQWVQETKFSDRGLAKTAIGHVCAAAREMNLKTLDDARALSFDEALERGSIAFRGLKNVLDTYGLSIDQMADSVKTEVISQEGANAKVRVSYTFLNTPLSVEADLVQVDGRWYGKQTIENLNKPEVDTSVEESAEESVEG
jgi:hypothetical protein